MQVKTRKSPILGKDGNYAMWIRIPNIPGEHDPDTRRLLSISKHSTVEITYDNDEKSLLVFPIGRYITIIASRDNRNQTIWITNYNDKDLREASEHPTKNPDENLR